MDDERKVELMEEYVNAFNEQSIEQLEELISPIATVEVNGTPVQNNRDEFLASLPERWEQHSGPVEIEEMTPNEDGGLLKFADHEGTATEVQITWDEEGLIIKQEIMK